MDSDTLPSAASRPHHISARKEGFPTPMATKRDPSAPGRKAGRELREGASSGREKKRSKVARCSSRVGISLEGIPRDGVLRSCGPGVLGSWVCRLAKSRIAAARVRYRNVAQLGDGTCCPWLAERCDTRRKGCSLTCARSSGGGEAEGRGRARPSPDPRAMGAASGLRWCDASGCKEVLTVPAVKYIRAYNLDKKGSADECKIIWTSKTLFCIPCIWRGRASIFRGCSGPGGTDGASRCRNRLPWPSIQSPTFVAPRACPPTIQP